MIINELITKLSFKLDQATIAKYEQRMKAAANSGNQFGKSMLDAFGKARKGAEDAGRGADVYRDKLGRLRDAQGRFVSEGNKGFGKMGGSMHGLTGSIAKLTAGFVGLSAVSSGAKFIGGAASEYETAITQLTTLVGKDKAGGIFKDLQKFAAETPYELKDVMSMFTRLEGSGFQLLDKQGRIDYKFIENIGDLAAASNKPLSEAVDMMLSMKRGLGSMTDNFVGLAALGKGDGLDATMFDRSTGKTTKTRIKEGDPLAVKNFINQAGQRQGISGGMDALAKTLSGQMSTLKDTGKMVATSFFLGFGPHIHKYLERMIKLVGDLTPQAEKLGKMVGKQLDKLPAILKAAKPFIEPVAIGLGMIATAMIAMKGFALASGVVSFLGFLGSIGGATVGFITTAFGAISGFLTLASGAGLAGTLGIIGTTLGGIVTAALPIIGAILTGGVIVGAIALIVALGVKLADYWARGDVALKGLHEKFPILADGIKIIGDEMAAWWPIIQNVLIGGFNLLWPVIQWGFNMFVNWLGLSLKNLGMVSGWIRTAVDFWFPLLTGAFEDWKRGMEPVFNWLGEQFTRFFGWLEQGKNLVGGVFGAVGNALGIGNDWGMGGGGGAQAGFAGLDTSFGARFATIASSVAKSMGTVNNCAYGFETSFEKMTGIAMRGHAFELKAQMDKNKKFRRVEVSDAQMANLPAGTVVIHDRNLNYRGKGLGGQYGHVSVALGNGMEASDHIQKQMVRHYAGGARYVYIPVDGSMPASAMGANGQPVINNNIKVDARGATSPEAVKAAAKNGTGEALNKSGMSKQRPAAATRSVGAALG